MKNKLLSGRWAIMLLLGFLFVQSSFAQNEPGPVTHTYALTNANIITKPGQMISKGTVVVRNGLIHSVGQNVSIPSNAKVLKGDSLYVYAAFIDGLSHVGVPKPKTEANNNNRGRGNQQQGDPGNPTNERAGITPDADVQDQLKHDDKSISDFRKAGFGAAHTVPRGRMLAGSGSIIVLEGNDSDELVMKANISSYAQLRGAGGVYPATVIGVMSKFRELYKQAQQAKAHIDKYNANPAGIKRPNYDDATLAMIPVVTGQMPLYYLAEDHLTMSRVLTLQKELGFKLILTGAKKGWHHIDAIKANNVPIFLSMDLPKAPADKKKAKKPAADNEPDMQEGGKEEMKKEPSEFDKERKALQARKDTEYKEYVSQAATFSKAGVNFGFITEGTAGKDVHGNLRRMIEHGLSEDAALAALTTFPAQQLGVSRMLGTVEKGKVANLMITNQPYFNEKAAIRYMIVDGEVFEFEVKDPKKKKTEGEVTADDGTMASKVAGEWSYEISIPGMEQSGTLTIRNDDGELSGFLTSDQDDSGEELDVENLVIDGQEFSFEFEAEGAGTVTVVVTLDEETFDGDVSVGEFGTFPIKGEKVPQD